MLRLKQFYKPFILSLLLAIVLLFVQAFADLNLPNYMSDIVSVGIQQGGIDHGSTEIISQEAYDFIYTLSSEENKELLDASYGLETVVDEAYPNLLNQEAYVLESTHDRDALDLVFGEALWTLIEVGRAQGSSNSNSMSMAGEGLELSTLYPVAAQLKMMPASMLEPIFETVDSMDDMLKKQSAVVLAKAIYTEAGVDLDAIQMNYILSTGAIMILFSLIGAFAVIVVTYLGAKMGAGVAKRLRLAIFEKVESFSSAEFDQFSAASLITRSTNDITQIQQLIAMGVRIFFYAPIMAIGGIYMITQTNLDMVWIIGLSVSTLVIVIAIIFSIAVPKFKLTQTLVDKLNLVSRESLSGMMVVRAFGNQDFEQKRFDEANTKLADVLLFVSRIMTVLMPVMMLIMNVTIVAIVYFGAKQIDASNLNVGDMMAFMQYAMQVIMSFLMISMIFMILPRAQVSANRIADVLETVNTIVDPKENKSFDSNKKGWVEFKDVSFKYANASEDVLSKISFVAKPGTTTAIIGSTGSGKSTLIHLIPRFYDVTEGEIKVSGVNVKDIDQHSLREQIAYVPQKGMLLSGSIDFNLKYGKPDADQSSVKQAAEIAQAMDFIAEKEEGFDHHLAQAGANVSGGQKQRLSIARALVKDSPILIFDDSFSALDFKTDQKLRAALKTAQSNKTILIVAQRVNTIINADQIIVLENGQMVGMGTHEELLRNNQTYLEIASSQLSNKELGLQ